MGDDTYQRYRQRYLEAVARQQARLNEKAQAAAAAKKEATDRAIAALDRFIPLGSFSEDWDITRDLSPKKEDDLVALYPLFLLPREGPYIRVAFDGDPEQARTIRLRSSTGQTEVALHEGCTVEVVEQALASVLIPVVDPSVPPVPLEH